MSYLVQQGLLVAPTGPPPPAVSSVSPSSSAQGSAPAVTITGTAFVSGATVTVSGTGVTVGTVTFVSATQLTTTFTIAGGATVSARNVTVTNPDTQSGVGTGAFTVTLAGSAPAPIIGSVAPASAAQGTTPTVVITGSYFVAGATVACSGPGITVGTVTFVSSTELDVALTIAGGATVGLGDVTVTNPDAQSDVAVNAFGVTASGGGGGGGGVGTLVEIWTGTFLALNQAFELPIRVTDSAGVGLTGLAGSLVVTMRKSAPTGTGFITASPTLAINEWATGDGYYSLVGSGANADTAGPLTFKVTGPGALTKYYHTWVLWVMQPATVTWAR